MPCTRRGWMGWAQPRTNGRLDTERKCPPFPARSSAPFIVVQRMQGLRRHSKQLASVFIPGLVSDHERWWMIQEASKGMKSSRKAVLTAIVSDLAIATAKLTAWAFTHSSGMLSEAIHSLVDAGNGSLLVLGLHRSRKQADETHPFGYGKELYFWTLLVALFVFFAGGGASIAEGYLRVRNPRPLDHYLWNYVTLGVAGLFEGYSLYVGLEEFRAGEGVPASWQAIRASKNPSTFTVIVEDF